MSPVSQRFGWYLAALQLFFTLCWTVYAIYLPKLAAAAGIAPAAIILMLMADQLVFTVCDFASGVAADKVTRTHQRIGAYIAWATLLSCAAFLILPFVAGANVVLFIAATLVWTVTSSALRAPPLMLLGKYCAKPSLPILSSLAMLGTGIAGALAPYLAVTLREVDPRWPFVLSSVVLALTTFGMVKAERALASQPKPATSAPPVRSFGTLTKPALIFALALTVLALGYQMHFALNTAPLFLKFANPDELVWLMPVFWIGFNLSMFPASVITKKFGGYLVMGASGLIGALAILGAVAAQGLGVLAVAQFAAGAAWGAILMSAFTVAFAIGENGAEGRMAGLLFSALAVATLARMGTVAAGFAANPTMKAALQWVPTACWTLAGVVLIYLAVSGVRRWMGRRT